MFVCKYAITIDFQSILFELIAKLSIFFKRIKLFAIFPNRFHLAVLSALNSDQKY